MNIYYTLYQTVNIINNKIYIGVHKTTNPYDRYLGSGEEILSAIKIYGRNNFKKEILFFGFTEDDAYWAESIIVTEDFVKRRDTYNEIPGGRKPGKQFGNTWNCGRIPSIEQRNKIRLAHKGRKQTAEHRINSGLSKRGENNHAYDHTIHIWYHSKYGYEKCTRGYLRTKYSEQDLRSWALGKVIKGKHKQHRGWIVIN